MAQQFKIKNQLNADIREARFVLDKVKIGLIHYESELADDNEVTPEYWSDIHDCEKKIKECVKMIRYIDKLVNPK